MLKGIITIFVFYLLYRKFISPKRPKKHIYSFKVVGVTKKNDEVKDIQKLIRSFVKEKLEYECDAYEGLTNKEILEDYYDDRVYEASDVFGFGGIAFIPEPDNPYDSNAIKVIHEDMGHIGYVPKKDIDEVRRITDIPGYQVSWDIIGGKYKYVDWGEDKVRVEKDYNYGIEIELIYFEKEKESGQE